MKQENKKSQFKQDMVSNHSDATFQAIDRLTKEIDKSSNRVAYSAIIAAFTIAGALLLTNATNDNLILIGIPFFGIAFFSSIMLISSIVKEPK